MKSDYRYSIGLVYNTFPMPPGDADLSKLEPLAHAVLDARAAHPDAMLAVLYDPDLMPPALRRAHRALDRAVDRLYRRGGFASERERVEHLFMLYERMRAPLEARREGEAETPALAPPVGADSAVGVGGTGVRRRDGTSASVRCRCSTIRSGSSFPSP